MSPSDVLYSLTWPEALGLMIGVVCAALPLAMLAIIVCSNQPARREILDTFECFYRDSHDKRRDDGRAES